MTGEAPTPAGKVRVGDEIMGWAVTDVADGGEGHTAITLANGTTYRVASSEALPVRRRLSVVRSSVRHLRTERIEGRGLLITWECAGAWHLLVIDGESGETLEACTYIGREDLRDAASCVRAGLPNR